MVKKTVFALIPGLILIGCAGAPQPAEDGLPHYSSRPAQPSGAVFAQKDPPVVSALRATAEASFATLGSEVSRQTVVELPEPRMPAAFEQTPTRESRTDEQLTPVLQPERHPAAAPSGSQPGFAGSVEAPRPDPAAAAADPAATRSQPRPEAHITPATIDRLVTAAPEREFAVRLEGTGWIYLSADRQSASQSDGIEYRRRHTLDGDTEVILRATETGDYTLRFQRQNLSDGTLERSLIALTVSPDGGRAAAAAGSVDTGAGSAEALPESGEITAEPAIPDDPHEIAAAARHAMDSNNPELATALWRRNRSLEQPLGTEARHGLLDLALRNSSYSEAVGYAQQMLDHNEAPAVAAVTQLSEYSLANNRAHDALDLLQRRLALFDEVQDAGAAGRDRDALLFQLAQLYETDAGRRNLRKSLSYYRRITDEFPLSRYWEPSRARIEYIERHFIHVR